MEEDASESKDKTSDGAKQHKPPYVAFADIEIGDNISDQSKSRMNDVDDAFCLTIDRAGLINPLTVREGGPSRTTGKRRVVLDCGFRRYGAIARLREGKVPGQKSKPSSWNQIPVRYVKGNETDRDSRNLVENVQRLNLNPYEEAAAIKAYMDKHGVTQSEVARIIGKSDPYVSQRLSTLRNTSPELRKAFDEGIVSATMAREISDMPKDKQPALVETLRKQAATGKYPTVDDVRDDIAKQPSPKKKTGRKRQEFDQAKITSAKEAYAEQTFAPRPRPALMEALGTLVQRDQRNSTDKTKFQIQTLEFVLGLRDTL